MKDAVLTTGGLTVQTDTYHNVVFKDSLKRLFTREGEEGFLGLSSNATFEVIPSRDIKVRGPGAAGGRCSSSTAIAAVARCGRVLSVLSVGPCFRRLCAVDACTRWSLRRRPSVVLFRHSVFGTQKDVMSLRWRGGTCSKAAK